MRFASLILLLLATPAFAQENTDDLKKVIEILQVQRNNAMNMHAGAEARSEKLREQNEKLNARIKELESKKDLPETAPIR
jgi:cell division protein FtsB